MRSRANLILILMIAALAISSALQAQAATRTIVVPQNTVIPVVLDTPVSSATSRVGDIVQAHCYGSYCGGFPANTRFIGRLTMVQPKQPKAPGRIRAELTSAVLPNGTQVPISALPSTRQGVPKEGTGKSAQPKNRRTGTVAGGAIGAIAGGWKGAAIGAGAGYLTGKAVEGKYTDVSIPAGTTGYITMMAPAKFQAK